jgi:carbamoyltransferase
MWVGHHLSHAASTFYASPFDDAAILVIDGIGDDSDTAAYFHGVGKEIRTLQTISFPHSLGFLWELLSLFLGFSLYDAAKIMGLASYGDPRRYAHVLEKLVRPVVDGKFELDNDLLRLEKIVYYPPSADFTCLEELFGLKARHPHEELTQAHRDIAAALQQKTNELVHHILVHLHQTTGSKNICLAGGVALNCVTNRHAFEASPFEHLYVQAGANDAGTAVGAAAHIWHNALGHEARQPMLSPYTGPAFSNGEIEASLQAHGLKYERVDDIERKVASLIAQGAVVGYFQGQMEFGPRALGSRSILADPRNADMREILNHKVKHREYFRPFAPSVLYEEVNNWFEIAKETTAADFMLMAYPAKATVKDRIPAVLHVDGTGRIQTVKKDLSPRYHRVISEFYELTGIPIVLNTSFNDQEPIICTPSDAVNTFLKTNIDYLAIGDFLVHKVMNL